jgi:hypothetical protein
VAAPFEILTQRFNVDVVLLSVFVEAISLTFFFATGGR